MAGCGGAIKDSSIAVASREGKPHIHTAPALLVRAEKNQAAVIVLKKIYWYNNDTVAVELKKNTVAAR